jgi:hypothetical protein
MAKKTAPLEGTKMEKEFSFELTEKETAHKGLEAAALAKECAEIERDFDRVKKEFSARIKDRESRRDELLTVIDEQKELRTVEVLMTKDFNSKLVQFWFKNKVLEERAMTQQELQMELDLAAKEKAKAAAKTARKHSNKRMNDDDAEGASDISGVIRSETSRRTKRSSVDESSATQ